MKEWLGEEGAGVQLVLPHVEAFALTHHKVLLEQYVRPVLEEEGVVEGLVAQPVLVGKFDLGRPDDAGVDPAADGAGTRMVEAQAHGLVDKRVGRP